MFKKVLSLSILVFILSMACVSATEVHNFDDIPVNNDVIHVNDDVINLDEGDYKVSHSLEVKDNLTINGNGQTIDGNNERFLTIDENATVYLNNLTLTNCQVKDHKTIGDAIVKGGAIVNHGTLYINNCKFLDNSIESGEYGYGGVIYNTGNLEIANSTFKDNYVFTWTSSFFSINNGYGGAIYNENNCKISDCNFTNNNVNKNHNKADNSYGGAIANIGFMEINNSNFLNNIVFSESTFGDIRSYGGAIYSSGTLNLRNCSLLNNKASTHTKTAIPTHYSYGGAICSMGILNILDSLICSNNSARFGGAIYSNNTIIANASCIFNNNYAEFDGGAIYSSEILSFSKSVEFKNNRAEYGGAIYNSGIIIFECDSIDFSNNTAKKYDNTNQGNTIYNLNDMGMTFINGKAYKGALNENIMIKNGDLNRTSFSRDGNDYVIRYLNCDGKEINDSVKEEIRKGNYKSYTYSIQVNSTSISLIHSEYIYNITDLKNFINKYSSNPEHWTSLNLYLNPSIYNFSSSVFKFKDDLKEIKIYGNGAIFNVANHKDRDETHFLEISNSQIALVNNVTCIGFNTAILNHGLLKVESCNFTNNGLKYITDQDFGGAIKNIGVLFCSNSTFEGNYAKHGGAIYNAKNSYCNIENSTFKDTKRGGDVYNFENVNYTATNSNLTVVKGNEGSGFFKALVGIITTVVDVAITGALCIINPALGFTIGSLSTLGLGALAGSIVATVDQSDKGLGALSGAMFGIGIVLSANPVDFTQSGGYDAFKFGLEGLFGRASTMSINPSELLKAELKAANYDIPRAWIGADTSITANATNVTYGENVTINYNVNTTQGTILNNENVTITVSKNDMNVTTIIDNLTSKSVTLSNLDAGNYTAKISYLGDDNFNFKPSSTSINFTVNEATTKVIANSNVTYGENVIINHITINYNVYNTNNTQVTIPNNEKVTITISNIRTGRIVTTIIGNLTSKNISLSNLDAGNYTAKITYLGDGNFKPSTTSINFTVYFINSTIIANATTNGTNVIINYNIYNSNNAVAIIPKYDFKEYVTVVFGRDDTNVTKFVMGKLLAKSITLRNLEEGNYTAKVTYLGNNNYIRSSTTNIKFTVTKATTTNTTTDGAIVNNNEGTLTVINSTFKDNKPENIWDLNPKHSTKSVSNGAAFEEEWGNIFRGSDNTIPSTSFKQSDLNSAVTPVKVMSRSMNFNTDKSAKESVIVKNSLIQGFNLNSLTSLMQEIRFLDVGKYLMGAGNEIRSWLHSLDAKILSLF